MACKKLGRRNAAPVQSTELDLPSCCPKHAATVRRVFKKNKAGERELVGHASVSQRRVYLKTWDMEGSLKSPPDYVMLGARNSDRRGCSSPSPSIT